MKNVKSAVVSGLLLVSFSGNLFAQNIVCREAYEAKIAKMEKNKVLRTVGRGASIAVLLAGAAVGGPITATIFAAAAMGNVGHLIVVDREGEIKFASELFDLAQTPRAELVQEASDEFDRMVQAIDSDPKEFKSFMKAVNSDRKRRGLPLFSEAQARAYLLSFKYDVKLYSNTIDKYAEANKISYEQVQDKILEVAQGPELCEKKLWGGSKLIKATGLKSPKF